MSDPGINDAVAPPMLRPADVAALGHWLRGAGMRIHPGQVIAATRLLTGARRPPPVADLAPWLAPVFCTNTAEQEAFGKLYSDWLEHIGMRGGDDEGDTPPVNPPPPPPPRRWPRILLTGILLVASCVVVLKWYTPPAAPPPVEPPPVATQDSAESPAVRGAVDMQPIDILTAPTKTTLLVPAQTPTRAASATPHLALRTGGVLILLGALGWWLYSVARRRGFLERLPADDDTTRRRLATSATPALAAYASALRYLGRELRRRRITPSRRLDISATLAATVRAGGLPCPIFGSLGEPVYLVLVDRAGAADHQAALGDEVVHFFHAQGVAMERYEFDGDPRFSRYAPLEGAPLHMGTQSLEALQARHPGARLIIFSDGNGLIDHYTGMPGASASGLLEWPEPALITPQPARLWAKREWALAQVGLTVLPLDADGLRGLGHFLRERQSWGGIDRAARSRTRPAYLRDVDLLLDRRPLDGDTLDLVMHDLERDLGPDGLAWLAACAVYPEIHWAITLAVGDSITPERRRGQRYAQRLAQISRLPWMRMGFMPDWFRSALLARLAPEREQAVRAALDSFLASVKAATGQHASALEIATDPRRRAWNDVLAGLRVWGGRLPRAETREDAIFLHFMNGPRKSLTVEAGRALMRLLYRDGVPLRGPRPWLPLAALLLAAGAFFVPTAPPPPPSPSKGVRQVDPAPAAIALSASGDRIAVIDDVSRVVVKLVPDSAGKAGAPACQALAPGGKPLWVGAEGVVRFGWVGPNGLLSGRLPEPCPKDPTYQVLPLKRVVGDPAGRLSFATLAPADANPAAMLCTKVRTDDVVIAERTTIDAALPAGAGRAVACAFAEDATSLLVAARSGTLFEYSLASGARERIDRGPLPASTGAGYSIATNRLGGDIAAVAKNGKVFLKRANQDWRALSVDFARPPVAISAQGETLAFASTKREVAVWRTMKPLPAASTDFVTRTVLTPTSFKTRGVITVPAASPKFVAGTVLTPTSLKTRGLFNLGPKRETSEPSYVPSRTESTPVEITEYSVPNSPKVKFVANVFFEDDGASLSDSSTLDKLLVKLRDVDLLEVKIVAQTNQKLSEGMASSVVEYLTARGIPRSVITTEGSGQEQPVPAGPDGTGRQVPAPGQRVEIGVIALRRQPVNAEPAPAREQPERSEAKLRHYQQETPPESRPLR
jgi:hypothetical protein